MRLVLVMPPSKWLLAGFANGLVSLANYVDRNVKGVDVQILNFSEVALANLNEAVRQNVEEGGPMVVGVTTTTATYQAALASARAFKETHPDCTVVFGGHHATGDPETILRNHRGLVDYVVIDEGEKPLAGLIRQLHDPTDVSGIAFLREGEYIENPMPPRLGEEELDKLPITFDGEGLYGTPGKFEHVTYVSARGCPLRCKFCVVSRKMITAKSDEQFQQDILELVEMGYRRIAIEDNFFAHSRAMTRRRCEALIPLQEAGHEFSWDCQTRVEAVAREGTVPLLERAGCEAVYMGVESLNPDHIAYLNKTNDPDRYLRLLGEKAVPCLLDSTIDCYLNLQFGIPGENEGHHQHTLSVLQKLGAMAAARGEVITVFPQLHVIYPGTQHFKEAVAKGWFPRDIFESFTAWEAETEPILRWMGNHFAHGIGGIPVFILNAEKLAERHFEVEPARVEQVTGVLERIDALSGIHLFKYGTHLVDHSETPPAGLALTAS